MVGLNLKSENSEIPVEGEKNQINTIQEKQPI